MKHKGNRQSQKDYTLAFKLQLIETDAYSCKIVGHHLSEELRTEWVAQAPQMAIQKKSPLIHHSVSDLQYCSQEYQSILSAQKSNQASPIYS